MNAVADGRRGLRRAEDLMPGSRVQSRGDSDTLALPAGTKSVQELEASVNYTTEAARGHIDELWKSAVQWRSARTEAKKHSASAMDKIGTNDRSIILPTLVTDNTDRQHNF